MRGNGIWVTECVLSELSKGEEEREKKGREEEDVKLKGITGIVWTEERKVGEGKGKMVGGWKDFFGKVKK